MITQKIKQSTDRIFPGEVQTISGPSKIENQIRDLHERLDVFQESIKLLRNALSPVLYEEAEPEGNMRNICSTTLQETPRCQMARQILEAVNKIDILSDEVSNITRGLCF